MRELFEGCAREGGCARDGAALHPSCTKSELNVIDYHSLCRRRVILPYLASRQSAHHHKKQPKQPSQCGVYLMFAIIFAIAVGTYLAAWGLSLANSG